MKKIYAIIDNIQKGEKLIKAFIIVFQTLEYKLLFIFNIKMYITGLLFFLCFLFCYFQDFKLYSFYKNFLIDNVGLINYNFYLKILFFFIIGVMVLLLLILYKRKTKEEFKNMILLFIYYRLNFFLNYNIFLKLFKINTIEFIEYNFIIIIIFIIYILILILGIIIKNKKLMDIKIIHYLSLPLFSILYWIIIFWNVSEEWVFVSLFFDYRLKDFDKKNYDIIYNEQIQTILVKKVKNKN